MGYFSEKDFEDFRSERQERIMQEEERQAFLNRIKDQIYRAKNYYFDMALEIPDIAPEIGLRPSIITYSQKRFLASSKKMSAEGYYLFPYEEGVFITPDRQFVCLRISDNYVGYDDWERELVIFAPEILDEEIGGLYLDARNSIVVKSPMLRKLLLCACITEPDEENIAVRGFLTDEEMVNNIKKMIMQG